LWDIKAKALGLPLWRLLGGGRDRVPAYASGALRRRLSPDGLAATARALAGMGYRQVKTQCALPEPTSPALEVERMKIVRAALGPEIDLMCDINQGWRVEQAIEMGHRLEDAGIGLFWLEDVSTHDDYDGLARVAASLATPVAGGEYVWGITPFRHMIERRSVDIVMIDLARVGGITPWLKVAGMAEAFNLPVVSHVFPELHQHLVAAAPNGLTVEYMPRFRRLFVDAPVPQQGMMVLPSEPGIGLSLDRAMIERYRAA
jgi:L-alanine-DL-glutamate epimerase-like enolase superfamily enzyme